jgi:hypothetical protein
MLNCILICEPPGFRRSLPRDITIATVAQKWKQRRYIRRRSRHTTMNSKSQSQQSSSNLGTARLSLQTTSFLTKDELSSILSGTVFECLPRVNGQRSTRFKRHSVSVVGMQRKSGKVPLFNTLFMFLYYSLPGMKIRLITPH